MIHRNNEEAERGAEAAQTLFQYLTDSGDTSVLQEIRERITNHDVEEAHRLSKKRCIRPVCRVHHRGYPYEGTVVERDFYVQDFQDVLGQWRNQIAQLQYNEDEEKDNEEEVYERWLEQSVERIVRNNDNELMFEMRFCKDPEQRKALHDQLSNCHLDDCWEHRTRNWDQQTMETHRNLHSACCLYDECPYHGREEDFEVTEWETRQVNLATRQYFIPETQYEDSDESTDSGELRGIPEDHIAVPTSSGSKAYATGNQVTTPEDLQWIYQQQASPKFADNPRTQPYHSGHREIA